MTVAAAPSSSLSLSSAYNRVRTACCVINAAARCFRYATVIRARARPSYRIGITFCASRCSAGEMQRRQSALRRLAGSPARFATSRRDAKFVHLATVNEAKGRSQITIDAEREKARSALDT